MLLSGFSVHQVGVSKRDHLVLDCIALFDLVNGTKCSQLTVSRHPTQRVDFAHKTQCNGVVDEVIAADAPAMQGIRGKSLTEHLA